MQDLSRFAARLLPARSDVAARGLEAMVTAGRFEPGVRRSVHVPLLDLTASPGLEAERATQLLFGEIFTVYDEADGFAWGQTESDGYVGYVPADGLGEPIPADRRVSSLFAHVYPVPSIKSRPGMTLPLGARVAVDAEADGFARLRGGGFVPLPQLGDVTGDAVEQAMRLIGVPYLWGGRSAMGIDCSALVQLSLALTGVAAPRDSDMQAVCIGRPVEPGMPVIRGDLVFWKGHVGIVADEGDLVHANAGAMSVTREPLAAVCRRIEASGGGGITAIRRGAADRLVWRIPLFSEAALR